MTQATEDFIRAFEAIRGEVNRRAGLAKSQSFEIEAAATRDGVVERNRRLLRYIRDVRNALQHPQHGTKGHAVQISDAFLSEVTALLNHLLKPPTANTVGVPRAEIRTARPDDCLGDLADEMKRRGFSHMPILDERDAVIGVFNEAAVFASLWVEADTIIDRKMRVQDILPHCLLDAAHTETFRFVRPGTPLDDLVALFVAVESPTTRIGAAFVTASGKKTDALQRLITPWDVLAKRQNRLAADR